MTKDPSQEMPQNDEERTLGYRIALIFVWGMFIYLNVVAFSSIIPQIFPEVPPAPDAVTCSEELGKLEGQLRDYGATFTDTAALSEHKLKQEFKNWDTAFHQVRGCKNSEALWVARHRLYSALRHLAWVEGSLLNRLATSKETQL